VLSGKIRDSSPIPGTPRGAAGPGEGTPEAIEEAPSGRFDFDLAEFPLFRFYKNAPGRLDRNPLVYADTLPGRDGEAVTREWKAYPGPFGFGGPSTQLLLYDLLQLYAEQGYRGAQLRFGTIRSLLLRRGYGTPRSGITSVSGGTWTSSAGTTSTAGTPSGTRSAGPTSI
jgi:hypothetical protein